jgi:hypothetical protein
MPGEPAMGLVDLVEQAWVRAFGSSFGEEAAVIAVYTILRHFEVEPEKQP